MKEHRALANAAVTSNTEVLNYLCAAYLVDPVTAATSLTRHREEVQSAITFRSMAYYPGDRIAQAEEWAENPNFNPDEDEDEEDEA